MLKKLEMLKKLAADASDSTAACICNAGFSGVREELCTQCPVAKYRAVR